MSGLNKQDVNERNADVRDATVPDVNARGAGRWRVPVAVLALVALAVGAGGLVLTHRTAAQPAAPPMQAAPTVPVTVATVTRQNYPVYLSGLGTVQAFYSVQLRPQVDGTLLQVPVAEGQAVKQGDLLAVIDPRPYQATLDAASAKKQQDQADLANAKRDMDRYTSLAKQDFASHQQVDTQVALVNHLVAAIAGDDAQVEAAKLNVGYCYITAPFSGRVGLRTVDPGNFMRAAEVTSLMPLAQIQPIAVTFTVPQDALPGVQNALRNGQPPVVALASDDKTELDRGTLTTIDNTIDSTTGTIKLKATFPNKASRLWPGQFVNTRVLVGTDANALTVPSAAVQHGQDRLYVFVLNPDQTVAARTVEITHDNGELTIVSTGLEEGQKVVTDGQARLQNGSHVTLIAAAPKPATNAPRAGG